MTRDTSVSATLLPLREGHPKSHYPVRRIRRAGPAVVFKGCFVSWISGLRDDDPRSSRSIEGPRATATTNGRAGALRVSAWAARGARPVNASAASRRRNGTGRLRRRYGRVDRRRDGACGADLRGLPAVVARFRTGDWPQNMAITTSRSICSHAQSQRSALTPQSRRLKRRLPGNCLRRGKKDPIPPLPRSAQEHTKPIRAGQSGRSRLFVARWAECIPGRSRWSQSGKGFRLRRHLSRGRRSRPETENLHVLVVTST